MKLEIKEQKRNALMKREEAVVSMEHGGKATPNRNQVLAEVARLLNARPEDIIIDRIITPGGRASSEARVLAYSRKEDIPAWRFKKMEQRLAKAKKKAEEKPAGAREEPRPTESKEDAKEERAGAEAGQGSPEEGTAAEEPPKGEMPEKAAEEKPAEGPGQEEPAQGEKAPEENPGEERSHEAKEEAPSPGEDSQPEEKKHEKDRPEEGAG